MHWEVEYLGATRILTCLVPEGSLEANLHSTLVLLNALCSWFLGKYRDRAIIPRLVSKHRSLINVEYT